MYNTAVIFLFLTSHDTFCKNDVHADFWTAKFIALLLICIILQWSSFSSSVVLGCAYLCMRKSRTFTERKSCNILQIYLQRSFGFSKLFMTDFVFQILSILFNTSTTIKICILFRSSSISLLFVFSVTIIRPVFLSISFNYLIHKDIWFMGRTTMRYPHHIFCCK